MLQAAIDGLGVALTEGPLAADDLAAGKLVRPFDTVLRSDTAITWWRRRRRWTGRRSNAFRKWIFGEVERYKQSPEGKIAAVDAA